MKKKDGYIVDQRKHILGEVAVIHKKEEKNPNQSRKQQRHLQQANSKQQQQQSHDRIIINSIGTVISSVTKRKTKTKASSAPSSKLEPNKKNSHKNKNKSTCKSNSTTGTSSNASTPKKAETTAKRSRAVTLSPSQERHHQTVSCTPPIPVRKITSWRNFERESAHIPSAVTGRLHEEILAYAKQIKEKVDEVAVHVEQVLMQVRKCVQGLWPGSKVETFGSYSTGIWLPSSDVDLVVLDVDEVTDSISTIKSLKALTDELKQQAWVKSLVVLETAKVPVIKLVSAGASVPIDITFESSTTHSGLLARDLIKKYAEELPELYPLAVVFKQLLRERDLNDVYTGGLSSYSIVLMLIHFSLLWRNGEKCFDAAAIFASGALPPPHPSPSSSPSIAIKKPSPIDCTLFPLEKPHHQNELSSCATTPASSIASQSPINSPMKSCDVVESFAAIVATPSISLHCKTQEEPMSYADIAKGKLKAFEKKKSYASIAAAAPKKILSTSCRAQYNLHDPLISPMHPTNSSDDLCMSPSKGPQKVHLDAISVTSSSADTDDSSSVASGSSNCSRMSTEDIEEEPMKTSSFCLGEHTINILEFFGLVFDYRTNGLSIRDGGYIYRLAQSSDLADIAKPALVIEDPIHPDRNVSVASFAFSKVVAVFEDSFYALKYYRPTKFSPSALSCLLSCTSDGGTMSSS